VIHERKYVIVINHPITDCSCRRHIKYSHQILVLELASLLHAARLEILTAMEFQVAVFQIMTW